MNKEGQLRRNIDTFTQDTKGLTPTTQEDEMESPRTQHEEKERFNKLVNDDIVQGRKLAPYTWIYRWEEPTEF